MANWRAAQPKNQTAVLPGVATSFVNKSFATDDGGFTVVNTDPEPPGPFFYDGGSGVWYADGGVDALRSREVDA